MSSLNLGLNLDFMSKQEPPVQYIQLTPEEELQIVQDSNRLLEQIDNDCRLLDHMCSAYENLIILKEHYEQYGSSPALEVLVGDIKEYLGISLEADESSDNTDTSDNTDDNKSGGLGGSINKIWNWIVNLFKRIGEWIGIVDKKVDSDSAKIESKLKEIDLNKYYTVKHLKPLYQDNTLGKIPDCSSIEQSFKSALSNSSFGGGESSAIDSLSKAVEALKPYTELAETELKGTDIKTLYKNTRTLWKSIYRINKNVGPGLKQIQENMNSGEKPKNDAERKNFDGLVNALKKAINYIKLTMHRAAVSIAAISKTLYGKDNQSGRTDADIAKEKQEKNKLIEQGRQEQKQQEDKEKEQANSNNNKS